MQIVRCLSKLFKKSQAALYLYARAEEKNKKPRSSGSVKLGYGADDMNRVVY